MKELYVFNTMMMNGTVTMGTEVSAFATRSLAEETRLDIIEANKNNDGLSPFRCVCSEVEKIYVYENKNDIPFYRARKRAQRLTPEERQHIMSRWLSDNLHEIDKPKDAKFDVGQRFMWHSRFYEIIGYYAYNLNRYPTYLVFNLFKSSKDPSISGIPIQNQDDFEIIDDE